MFCLLPPCLPTAVRKIFTELFGPLQGAVFSPQGNTFFYFYPTSFFVSMMTLFHSTLMSQTKAAVHAKVHFASPQCQISIDQSNTSASCRCSTRNRSPQRERETIPAHHEPSGIGSCGERITQCGVGPCFFQKASGSLGACFAINSGDAHVSIGGKETTCGCALQYGRAPGLARYLPR